MLHLFKSKQLKQLETRVNILEQYIGEIQAKKQAFRDKKVKDILNNHDPISFDNHVDQALGLQELLLIPINKMTVFNLHKLQLNGRDEVSKMPREDVLLNSTDEIRSLIDVELILYATRWLIRGLPMELCIKKTNIERYIAHEKKTRSYISIIAPMRKQLVLDYVLWEKDVKKV